MRNSSIKYVILLIFLSILLTVYTRVALPTEYIFFPWAIKNGDLIYRDFFINHGFLTYIMQIPLLIGNGVIYQIYAFRLLIIFTTVLFLYNVSKYSSSTITIICGLIFILLQYYYGLNTVWDEAYITPILIILYYSTKKINKYNIWISSILISLLTTIKPTTAIILIPLYILSRNYRLFIFPFATWLLITLYWYYNNGLFELYDNLIDFNRFYGQYFLHNPMFNFQWKLIGILGIFSVISEIILIRKSDYALHSLIFILFSWFLSFIPCCAEFHFTPFISISTIIISEALLYINKNSKFVFILLLGIYIFILLIRTYIRFDELQFHNDNLLLDPKYKYIIDVVLKTVSPSSTIYILGNQAELYYALNKHITLSFPQYFPFIKLYYIKIENEIIMNIENQDVDYIIDLYDKNYSELSYLHDYIRTKYLVIDNNNLYKLYQKN